MAAARNREIDRVLVWEFFHFAQTTRHLLTALEALDHLGVRLGSVPRQLDTNSQLGRAMSTIIGAVVELASSLKSECMTVSLLAAKARGRPPGRPGTASRIIRKIETLPTAIDLNVLAIQKNAG